MSSIIQDSFQILERPLNWKVGAFVKPSNRHNTPLSVTSPCFLLVPSMSTIHHEGAHRPPKVNDMCRLIGYCGMDCRTCDAYIATLNDDWDLREKTAKKWSQMNNVTIFPDQINCRGCRSEGIKCMYCLDGCPIRPCAIDRGLYSCGECPDKTTCPYIGEFVSNNPEVLSNLE